MGGGGSLVTLLVVLLACSVTSQEGNDNATTNTNTDAPGNDQATTQATGDSKNGTTQASANDQATGNEEGMTQATGNSENNTTQAPVNNQATTQATGDSKNSTTQAPGDSENNTTQATGDSNNRTTQAPGEVNPTTPNATMGAGNGENSTTGAPPALNTTVAVENETSTAPSVNTTEGGEATTTIKPNATINATTTIMTTTTVSPCGVNSDLIGESCMCVKGWIADPTSLDLTSHDPSNSSSCPCRDLCLAEVNGDTISCPSEATCQQTTCNFVTCLCPEPLKYDSYANKCVGPCELYGDSLCGTGLGYKCQGTDTTAFGFDCTCNIGFEAKDGVCQDIDECKTESRCQGEGELCINSPGSYQCSCSEGYLRTSEDKCQNVNECLNPRLHSCDHLCLDAAPPDFYSCVCYPGYTWNQTNSKCELDNVTSSCECESPDKTVCYYEKGDKKCGAKPGYTEQNGTFIDVKECGNVDEVGSWCGEGGMCVEGIGGSECICKDGYKNSTLYGYCTRVECPGGEVEGSQCIDHMTKQCRDLACPAPLTCGVNKEGQAVCKCGSQCVGMRGINVTSSIYQGTLIVTSQHINNDNDNSFSQLQLQIIEALGRSFGRQNIEVKSIITQSKKRDTSPPLLVRFLVATEGPNMTQGVAKVIRGQCQVTREGSGSCVLPGGVVVQRDSIVVQETDPCSDSPCPAAANLVCRNRTDVSGRFQCVCGQGYISAEGDYGTGYCRDFDECRNDTTLCTSDRECINTPGGYVCRVALGLSMANVETLRNMAIAFGILFFLTLFLCVGLIYLLMKKNKSRRELVPMTTTGGFDNGGYK